MPRSWRNVQGGQRANKGDIWASNSTLWRRAPFIVVIGPAGHIGRNTKSTHLFEVRYAESYVVKFVLEFVFLILFYFVMALSFTTSDRNTQILPGGSSWKNVGQEICW